MESADPKPAPARASPSPESPRESARTADPGARPIDPPLEPRDAGPSVLGEADDPSIVQRILQGETDLYRLLVERHQHHVYRLALRLAGGDPERAEDLAQEAFLRAYRGLAGFAFDAKFGTWLHRVTVNVAVSERRRAVAAKRGMAVSLDAPRGDEDEPRTQVAAPGRGPAGEVVGEEVRRAVMAAVESLDPELRVLVVLVNLEGHTYESAAAILEIPVGTVRSRLHRARAVLEQRLHKVLERP